MGAATARVRLAPGGKVLVQTAAHEIGTGVTTALALTAVQGLGVPLESVSVELGDSALPPAPVSGGSNSTASICNVVAKACEDIRDRLAQAATRAEDSPFHGADPATLRLADGALHGPDGANEKLDQALTRAAPGAIEAYAENIPHGIKPDGLQKLYKGQGKLAGGAKLKDRMQFAFGAQFVEVRVHVRTREVRARGWSGRSPPGRS